MSDLDEDDYGDIADEDFIEAFSQASQSLPQLLSPKRLRVSEAFDDGSHSSRRNCHESAESGVSGDEDEEGRAKKTKYRIHVGVDEVPPAQILGATQADGLPDSSPYRIRGPIYRKPRPEPPTSSIVSAKPSIFSAKSSIFSVNHRSTPTQPEAVRSKPIDGRISGFSQDDVIAREFDGLPSDAFSSPSPPNVSLSSSLPWQRLVAPQASLRQTTLFGGRAADGVPASQVNKRHNFVKDRPTELPTHHVLDQEALKTWVYPTNLGTIRDYQFSIVRNGLFNNLLVALPTGLGKTFIAATIMLNYFRWTKDAQIIFVAPTKPLVAQQVDACFKIVGIPRSATTMLTGEQNTTLRAEEWLEKRVFFMTPQTLINDLSSGIADPKKIVLLVVDEAHRATGNYAYVKVVQFLRRFNTSFRVLALTATPGASVEAVQDVIDNLEISHVEIRTEESIDIQQFVHRRNIDQILLDPSDEIIMVKELFAKALQPLVNQLCGQNAYWNKDPMALTPFALMQARKSWMMSDVGKRASMGVKGMMNSLFTVLASVAHGIKLLNYHGIGPFFSAVKDFRQGVENGEKGGKYRRQIIESPDFRKMMERIQLWLSKDDFVGHPKLTYLCDTVLNHFLDAGEGRLADGAPPSSTRVIVFAEFRDSAEDIARVLNRHGPMIRASVFVGQADSKRSEGMNQQKQQDTIEKFRDGIFNVLVATSIGEEGLDIGQVDLIVCYDASGSPIRMLQRMGRTGRKRAGNIVLLLMRGKEQDQFMKAKDNYEQMQKMISSGERFSFRHDLSTRILPRDVKPVVERRVIDIPPENTQDSSMPLPRRRTAKAKKKPQKKFHMPDGVETGFRMASRIDEESADVGDFGTVRMINTLREDCNSPLVLIPSVESVLLGPEETSELERRYQHVPGLDVQEVTMPNMTSQTLAQRSLLRTAKIPHGEYTKKCIRLLQTLASSQQHEDRYLKPYGDKPPSLSWLVPAVVEDEREAFEGLNRPTEAGRPKRKQPKKHVLTIPNEESDVESSLPILINHLRARKPALSLSEDESDDQHLPANRKNKRKRATFQSSEGPGDDLAHSEAPSQDSDNGSSLEDFLAEDKEEIAIGTLSSSRSSPPSTIGSRKKPFYEPTQFTATQDTNDDDDLPDVGEIARRKTKPTRSTPIEEPETEIEEPVAAHRGKRRRVVVDDSDE